MLQMRRFNMGAVGEADCPVFDGLFDYCAVGPWHVCHAAATQWHHDFLSQAVALTHRSTTSQVCALCEH